MLTADGISAAVKARFPLTQWTSEKAVKAAYSDIMSAYVTPALGEWEPGEGESDAEVEALRDGAVTALTYARLLYADVNKYAYASAKATKEETASPSADDLRRNVATYRRLGVAQLSQACRLLDLPTPPPFVAMLGEKI